MSPTASALARRLSAAAALLALTASTPAAQADAWPMYQGNASHTGYLPVAIDPGSLELHWEVDLGQYGLGPVVAADGYVFASEAGWDGDHLFALDKESGAVLWEHDFGDPFSVNPPSYADGRVYVQTCNHSSDTWVWGFAADTGAPVIQTPTSAQWESYWAPTLYDGSVYVNGGYYGGMYAVDGTTGQELWWVGLAQYDEWTPAVDEDHCYAYVGGTLTAVDRLTGAVAYTIDDPDFDWPGWSMQQAPVLGGMDDLIATNDSAFVRRLIVFDLEQQDIRYTLDEAFSGQPAVHGGRIYAINGGSLDVRDQLDGTSLWTWSPPSGQLEGEVVVTETHALVHTSSETHLVDLETHASAWSWPAAGHVSLGESHLFVAQADGTLTAVAYEGSPKPFVASPGSAKYYEAPPTVTLTGTAFDEGGALEVLFGDLPATDVVVLDGQTLTCTPPVAGPGAVAVIVQNDVGTGVLPEPFLYTPVVTHAGEAEPGGNVLITFTLEPFDGLLVLHGKAAAGLHPLGGWHGALGLQQPKVLLTVPSWPFATFGLSVDLPDDPALVGLAYSVQGLSGKPALGVGAWTNVDTIVVE